jgi:hypothetical protein
MGSRADVSAGGLRPDARRASSGQTETPAAEVRERLVACCEDAADWRLHRAAEFSHSFGALAAVDALESAAETIGRLRDDDPQLTRLTRVWNRLDPQKRMLALTEQRRAVRQARYERIATPTLLLSQAILIAEAILRQ